MCNINIHMYMYIYIYVYTYVCDTYTYMCIYIPSIHNESLRLGRCMHSVRYHRRPPWVIPRVKNTAGMGVKWVMAQN